MSSTSRAARLRARLDRIPSDHVATCRDLALEYVRCCPRNVSAWGDLADALVDLRLYSKARVALKRFETLTQGEYPFGVNVAWGRYYDAMGDLKRAERCYRKAAEAAPAGLVFLGCVVAKQGRLGEARRYHRQATRARQNAPLARDEAYYNLGLLFRAQRRYREALVNFERAIALDPKYSLALKMRADVQSALKVEAPEERAKHWRQILDALGSNYATCHELVRAFVKRYPERSTGWLALADVLSELACYDEAVEALRRSERLAKAEGWKKPRNDFFVGQWGLLYQTKKDFRRAESAFRRAVALRPSPSNLTHLAEVLVARGQLTEARRHLDRSRRLGPDYPANTHYQLALIARARGQYADALTNLDAAIRHSPNYPLARVARRDVRAAMRLQMSSSR